MAFYATRPLAEAVGEHDHEVALRVALAVAAGEAEARAKGMAQLREWCPPEEGWTSHHVTFSPVPPEALRGLLEVIADGPGSSGDADEPVEGPDVLM